MNKLGLQICALAMAVGALPPRDACAQGVTTSGKAIIGGGLLGAEVVVIGEAVAGLDEAWFYYAGAGLGAVGGATGGYFLESSVSPKASVLMLMAGMALIIPATIIGMNATRRHWPEIEQPEAAPKLPSDPPDPAAGPELVWAPLPTDAGALLRWSPAGLMVALPDVYLTETYTAWERWAFALPQDNNFQVALFGAQF